MQGKADSRFRALRLPTTAPLFVELQSRPLVRRKRGDYRGETELEEYLQCKADSQKE